MTQNMGTADRVLRTIIAFIIVILLLNASITGAFALILGAIAVAFLGTSAVGWCPLYKPFGISTRKTGQK